jgi:hypothetical protein
MPADRADPEAIRQTLVAALRAPSAHNAQPWRLTSLGDDAYELWYAYADKLLADPDDRDGIIAVGGFYETLRLAAEARGLEAAFEPAVRHHAAGIGLGRVGFGRLERSPDPLAASIDRRQCNRQPYSRESLPGDVRAELETIGNILLPIPDVVGLVSRASVLSWMDRRFVSDLERWTRFEPVAPDGMTFDCLRVDRFDEVALRLALALGKLPRWLAWFYAQRDVRLTRASSAMAVLTVDRRDPLALFDCGRWLIRSWTLLNARGLAWHPMSVVIDQATVSDLVSLIGGGDAVAIYRLGRPLGTAAWSQRRPLESILVQAPG